jgi:hypothetical protein
MLKELRTKIRSLFMYVIADATDNSITFSKRLFKHLDLMGLKSAQVFTFYIPKEDCYGFSINPPISEKTQLADVQYNSKKRCVGYECLVPTVNRIFYDYGLPTDTRCKLSIEVHKTQTGYIYYKICRPYGKSVRKHKAA